MHRDAYEKLQEASGALQQHYNLLSSHFMEHVKSCDKISTDFLEQNDLLNKSLDRKLTWKHMPATGGRAHELT